MTVMPMTVKYNIFVCVWFGWIGRFIHVWFGWIGRYIHVWFGWIGRYICAPGDIRPAAINLHVLEGKVGRHRRRQTHRQTQ